MKTHQRLTIVIKLGMHMVRHCAKARADSVLLLRIKLHNQRAYAPADLVRTIIHC